MHNLQSTTSGPENLADVASINGDTREILVKEIFEKLASEMADLDRDNQMVWTRPDGQQSFWDNDLGDWTDENPFD